MLHHNNAPALTSLLIRSYLAKHHTSVVPHPPYSPDLATADFFLFPKLKTTLKGHRFQTTYKIQENATREMHISQKVHFKNGKNFGNGVSSEQRTTLKGTVLKIM
jgi:transposase